MENIQIIRSFEVFFVSVSAIAGSQVLRLSGSLLVNLQGKTLHVHYCFFKIKNLKGKNLIHHPECIYHQTNLNFQIHGGHYNHFASVTGCVSTLVHYWTSSHIQISSSK